VATTSLAGSFINLLQVRPFCDGPDVHGLSPEQQAALHVFQHEALAAYFRVCEKVPEDAVLGVIERRLIKAAEAAKEAAKK
jgi:hypothetical protein